MTKFDHIKNVKAALNFIGPRIVLTLVLNNLIGRRGDTCNNLSREKLGKVAMKVEQAIIEMSS